MRRTRDQHTQTQEFELRLPEYLPVEITWSIPKHMSNMYNTLMCTICFTHKPSKIKVVCKNDHRLCKECYTDVDAQKERREAPNICPTCRENMISYDNAPSSAAATALQEFLRLPCDFRKYGCGYLPLIVDLEDHHAVCDHKRHPCIWSKRGCRLEVRLGDNHSETCGYKPVACPYFNRGCPVTQMNQKDLQMHGECCRRKNLEIGTPYVHVEGEGYENHENCQERLFNIDGFWESMAITKAEWVELNMIVQNTGIVEGVRRKAISQAEAKRRMNVAVRIYQEAQAARAHEESMEVNRQILEEIETRNNIARAGRNRQQQVVEIITIGDGDNQSVNLTNSPPNPLLENDDLILNASLDMETDQEEAETPEVMLSIQDGMNRARNLAMQALEVQATGEDVETVEAEAIDGDATDADTNPSEQDQVPEEQPEEPENMAEQAPVEEMEPEHVPEIFSWFSDRPAYSLEELSRTIHYMPNLATDHNEESQIFFDTNMLGNTATANQKNWARFENQRLIDNKVPHFMEIRNRHGHKPRYCSTCSESVSPLRPTANVDTAVFHQHFSTRLRMLEWAQEGNEGLYPCPCCRNSHHMRPVYRRKIIATSSFLRSWDINAKENHDIGYLGNESHVDLLSIPGGRVEDIAHALYIEAHGAGEPWDIACAVGINNVLNSLNHTQDRGILGLDSVTKAVHMIIAMTASNSKYSTVNFIRVPKVPMIRCRGKGFVMDRLNQLFRKVNVAMTSRWGVEAAHCPNFEMKGIGTINPGGHRRHQHQRYTPYVRREMFTTNHETTMLHFKDQYKLEMGREILRFWGINTGTATGRLAVNQH